MIPRVSLSTDHPGEVPFLIHSKAGSANQIRIRLASAPYYELSFGPSEQVASFIPIIYPGVGQYILNGGVKANTLPMMMFAAPGYEGGTLALTWHEAESYQNQSRADVYFVSKTPGQPWRPKMPIHAPAPRANDQFMPALDSDRNGNFLVAWYDRINDAGNIWYELYAIYVGPSGVPFSPAKQLYTPVSDPRNYFIGDYQGLWCWTFGSVDRFESASTVRSIMLTPLQGDILTSGIR